MNITIYTSESGTRSGCVDQYSADCHIAAGGCHSTEASLLLAFIESDEAPSLLKDSDGEAWILKSQGAEENEDFYIYELK
jgi:hypothetical protein